MSDSRPAPLAYVQALRGVAAMAVVLYHARIFIDGGRYLDAGSRLFGNGAAGVDLFFVISGFIMMHTTRELAGGPRDALTFAAKRLARIWPVYVVAFAAMWLVTRASDSPAFATTWAQTAQTLAFLPAGNGAEAPFVAYPLLHVGWTLVYEVFFYALFAVALLAPRRARVPALAGLFALCLIGLPLALTGDVHADARVGYAVPGYLRIVTNPIIWDFAMGVAIALLHRSRFQPRDRGLWACAAAIAAGAVAWQLLGDWREGHGPTRWGVPMAMLVLTLTMLDKVRPLAPPRWLVWLGDVSFSLYLFHILPQMLPRLWKSQAALFAGGGFFVACVVAALILAYLGYRFLERGLAEWVRVRLLRALGLGRR